MPLNPCPPQPLQESTIAASGKDPKGGKGGGKAADPKAKPSTPAGKKPGAADPSATAGSAAPVLLPRGARSNAGRHMRASLEAVLSMVDQLRAGGALYTGVVPLLAGSGGGDSADDDDAASYVTSAFSYGSDLQVGAEEWQLQDGVEWHLHCPGKCQGHHLCWRLQFL